MLKNTIAANVIGEAMSLGADFVDLFIEKNRALNISYLDRKVKDIKTGTDFGIGLRVVFNDQAIYGYTNSFEQEELLRIIRLLCSLQAAPAKKQAGPYDFTTSAPIINHHKSRLGLDSSLGLEEKISHLRKIDEHTRKMEQIVQVDLSTLQRWQQVEIYNSENLHVQDERHYTRLYATAIAREGQDQATGFMGPGGMAGWEVTELTSPEMIAGHISRRALTVLRARPCPAGKMPVIIDNGFGGVIFHEACGHLLETTSVEKKASVFHDKMNQMIAHSAVSAVDDGTVANQWGSINCDDEGMPTQKTQLIQEGRLVSFLVDRLGAQKTGYARTGSGRRQSYKFAPASRMRNTFIEPGKFSLDELLASVDRGLYAKAMGGGSVSPGTGEFNFSVEEAYLIEKGKIGEAVKGATLIGTGPEILQKISMVGNNFKLEPGMCGSVSGSIPVTVGQAALKVDDILVGGKA